MFCACSAILLFLTNSATIFFSTSIIWSCITAIARSSSLVFGLPTVEILYGITENSHSCFLSSSLSFIFFAFDEEKATSSCSSAFAVLGRAPVSPESRHFIIFTRTPPSQPLFCIFHNAIGCSFILLKMSVSSNNSSGWYFLALNSFKNLRSSASRTNNSFKNSATSVFAFLY